MRKNVIIGAVVVVLLITFAQLHLSADSIAKKVLVDRVNSIASDYPYLDELNVGRKCQQVKFERVCRAFVEAEIETSSNEDKAELINSLTADLEESGWNISGYNPGDEFGGGAKATNYFREGTGAEGCFISISSDATSNIVHVKIECLASGITRQTMLINLI